MVLAEQVTALRIAIARLEVGGDSTLDCVGCHFVCWVLEMFGGSTIRRENRVKLTDDTDSRCQDVGEKGRRGLGSVAGELFSNSLISVDVVWRGSGFQVCSGWFPG